MNTFDSSELKKYEAEAEKKWRETGAYKEYSEKTKGYSKDTWNNLAGTMNDIFEAFAACMKNREDAGSDEVQELVKKLQNHITENYYACTDMILMGLGRIYVCDERFKNNIDRYAEGTAEFICEAIEIYCGNVWKYE